MKITKKIGLTLIVTLFGIVELFSKGNPPPPPNNQKQMAPPLPGLAIDDNIYLLILITMLFGVYIIYKHTLKTKNPI